MVVAVSCPVVLFHITSREAWTAAQASGVYTQPGPFIHLSTPAQWRTTLDRFYGGVPDLVLLELEPAGLDVRFEPADDDMFPHLYGVLPVTAVVAVHDLTERAS